MITFFGWPTAANPRRLVKANGWPPAWLKEYGSFTVSSTGLGSVVCVVNVVIANGSASAPAGAAKAHRTRAARTIAAWATFRLLHLIRRASCDCPARRAIGLSSQRGDTALSA